jgi:mRNA interferase MazF
MNSIICILVLYTSQLYNLIMNNPAKELDSWAKLKKGIYFKKNRPYFRERDVWWASIGFNIGDEVYGKNYYFERPVLVLRKFNNNIFLAIPLSSKPKEGRYYCEINLNGKVRSVMMSQIRLIDAKRIIRKIGYLDESSFEKTKRALFRIMK